MVHGEIAGRSRPVAVTKDPLCAPSFPPLGFPQLPCFLFFSLDIIVLQMDGKGVVQQGFSTHGVNLRVLDMPVNEASRKRCCHEAFSGQGRQFPY